MSFIEFSLFNGVKPWRYESHLQDGAGKEAEYYKHMKKIRMKPKVKDLLGFFIAIVSSSTDTEMTVRASGIKQLVVSLSGRKTHYVGHFYLTWALQGFQIYLQNKRKIYACFFFCSIDSYYCLSPLCCRVSAYAIALAAMLQHEQHCRTACVIVIFGALGLLVGKAFELKHVLMACWIPNWIVAVHYTMLIPAEALISLGLILKRL